MVDLKQPRSTFIIKHHIKSKYLKHHLVFIVIWLTRAIEMRQVRLSHDYCLYDKVNNSIHQKININSLSFQLFQNSCKRSFMSHIIIVSVIVKLKCIVVLVDCIVSQVLEQVLHVSFIWLFILFCCQSCQPFFE